MSREVPSCGLEAGRPGANGLFVGELEARRVTAGDAVPIGSVFAVPVLVGELGRKFSEFDAQANGMAKVRHENHHPRGFRR